MEQEVREGGHPSSVEHRPETAIRRLDVGELVEALVEARLERGVEALVRGGRADAGGRLVGVGEDRTIVARVADAVAVGVGLALARRRAAVAAHDVAVVALLPTVDHAIAAVRAAAIGPARVRRPVAVRRAVVALLALRYHDAVAADRDARGTQRDDVRPHRRVPVPDRHEARVVDPRGPRAVRGIVGHLERRTERIAGRIEAATAERKEAVARVFAPDDPEVTLGVEGEVALRGRPGRRRLGQALADEGAVVGEAAYPELGRRGGAVPAIPGRGDAATRVGGDVQHPAVGIDREGGAARLSVGTVDA